MFPQEVPKAGKSGRSSKEAQDTVEPEVTILRHSLSAFS